MMFIYWLLLCVPFVYESWLVCLSSEQQLQDENPGSQRASERENRDRTEELFSYARHQATATAIAFVASANVKL